MFLPPIATWLDLDLDALPLEPLEHPLVLLGRLKARPHRLPRPARANPPSSALLMRTNVDFGVVLTAWLSGSNPHLIACTCFFLHGRLSNWCIGISQLRVMLCCAPYRKLL